MRTLQSLDTTFTVTYRLHAVEKTVSVDDGNAGGSGSKGDKNSLKAFIGSDYGGVAEERHYDQIIVNHGIIPLDDLYFELKPDSSNQGELDHEQLINGEVQSVVRNPEGQFQLFRIGDAVASRNTHAAILDALRLMKDI